MLKYKSENTLLIKRIETSDIRYMVIDISKIYIKGKPDRLMIQQTSVFFIHIRYAWYDCLIVVQQQEHTNLMDSLHHKKTQR